MSDRKITDIVVEYRFDDFGELSKTNRMTIPFLRLTPLIARTVLENAVDRPYFPPTGAVWWPDGGYGYRVYKRTVRKIYKRWDGGGTAE